MSNLWFFRLKRAEAQRRRSSGESLGSASVHSAAGVSAASLPVASSALEPARLEPLENMSEDEELEPSGRLTSDSGRRPDGQTRRASLRRQSSSWRFAAAAGRPHEQQQQQQDKMSAGPLQLAGDNQLPCLPRVTIIRSDSTSSFIPLEAGEPPSYKCNAVPLVSKYNARDGSVQSSCLPRGAAGLEYDQQQAAAAAAIAASNLEERRGLIHDQLISGKVPPIRKSLLSPEGAAGSGGLSVADSMDNLASLIPRVRVEFYNSENTLKEQLQMYFIKDHTVSLYIRTAKLVLKVLACYLYVCRVILDRGPGHADCYGCRSEVAQNGTSPTSVLGPAIADSAQSPTSKFDSYDGPINFKALFWVDRGPTIWTLQTTIAVICFFEALLMQYLTYKILTNVPFIVSIFWTELRTLFVPGFMNCWLAKQCLEAMLNDLSIVRQSSVFSHRLTILSATVFCLIFTSACGFQHTQRSGGRNYITIFESVYFVVVTFSTVGYGDFKPETWPSQLFIMFMICVALIVLPTQFEQLAYFWIERKKLGASYAHHSTRHEKHVVVCSTTLRADTIMDFLNEFYAHPLLQTFSVVLLSPCELDTTMKLVLQTPTWNNRVVYIQGSALKASDLIRARMQSAEACFILAARNYNDRSAADEHTILRSWAIRDFSPYVPQYVQIFRTENKIHVAFAEHVVCDDEFKYALLANNCLIPGTSTLVTLLLHTSQQQTRRRRRTLQGLLGACFGSGRSKSRRQSRRPSPANSKLGGTNFKLDEPASSTGGEPTSGVGGGAGGEPGSCSSSDEPNGNDEFDFGQEWKRLYGKCSANEIYHIRLSDSRFFGEYQGKSFTYASFHSHRKFGVALIGVQTDMRGTWPIMLNPGPSYVLKSGDILFYINITKEENSTLMPMIKSHSPMNASASSYDTKRLLSSNSPNLTEETSRPGPPMEVPVRNATRHEEAGQLNISSVQPMGGATFIRIESSSPTVAAGNGNQEQQLPTTDDSRLIEKSFLTISKKHSVVDGAGIVARSLCSMAGLPNVELPSTLNDLGDGIEPRRIHELQSLATTLLAKRNSSASTAGIPASGGAGGLASSRNASTLELASLAKGLRKGSNMSITSTKSRDASPTRLKQVVSGLAVKMKRVKLGKSLTHLTLPRMDYYGGSSASSTESFVNARGRRPSIAPVPAMMGESEEHDSDHEREQESYFAMSWQSSSESSAIVKKFVFCTTYVGVSPTLCYMLQKKKPSCCLQLINACEHCPYKNARQYNWPNRCIILASDFASNGIYNFLVPLRAHFHNPSELRPIVLLLERKPSSQFIDAISWFPMVYWMPGSIDNLDDLIKAGINMAHSVVVTNKESTNSAEEDYLADCNTIVAVQTMFKMFPSVSIITELSQSSNMRFMQFRAHDVLFGGLSMANYYNQQPPASSAAHQYNQLHLDHPNANQNSAGQDNLGADNSSGLAGSGINNPIRDRIQLRKMHSHYYNKTHGKQDVNSRAYKYRLPFAAGNVFSASMLDTLLYQAFVKDYMITMVRLLLGIDQAPGSGFLSSMKITKEDLWIRTYGRLYQRLCSTTCEIPLGIYRTEPLETQRHHEGLSFGAFASQQASYEHATEELERVEIINMVKNRLQDLGMLVSDYDDSPANRNNTFSYVIINPNCDISLREGDIIYLIRPSPIHSRKLFMHRANSVRHTDEHQNPTKAGCASNLNQFEPPDLGSFQAKSNQPESSKKHSAVPQGAEQVYMKSCLSDGDFNEILIKVNDQEEQHVQLESSQQSANGNNLNNGVDRNQLMARRRSSCSDAEESATIGKRRSS